MGEKNLQRPSSEPTREAANIRYPEWAAQSLRSNPAVGTILYDIQSAQLNATLKKLLLQIKAQVFEKFPQAGFNMWEFGEKLEKMMGEVMMSKEIPLWVKTKFVRDIESRVERLGDIGAYQLKSFAAQSMVNSLGVEAIELAGKTTGQKDAYYLSKVLDGTLTPYIEGASAGLRAAYIDEKIQTGKGVLVGMDNIATFKNEFGKLDLLYWFNMSQYIAIVDKDTTRWDISVEEMFSDIRYRIFKHYASIDPEFAKNTHQIRLTLESNKNFRIYGLASIPPVNTPNGKISIANIIESYRAPLVKFQGVEFETKRIKDQAESSGTINSVKSTLWFDGLKSSFEHINVDRLIEDMDKMSVSDTVRLFVQFSTLYPGIGDLISGVNGLTSAASGITLDGERMSNIGRGVSALLSVLGITLIWGLAIKGKNIVKIAKLMDKFALVRNNFPGKCVALLEKTKNLENGVLNAGIAGLKKALQLAGGPGAPAAIARIDAMAINSIETYRNATGVPMNVLNNPGAKISPLKAAIHSAKVAGAGESAYVDTSRANSARRLAMAHQELAEWLLKTTAEYVFALPGGGFANGKLLELTSDGKARMQYHRWNMVRKELVDIQALMTPDGRIRVPPTRGGLKAPKIKLPRVTDAPVSPSQSNQYALAA